MALEFRENRFDRPPGTPGGSHRPRGINPPMVRRVTLFGALEHCLLDPVRPAVLLIGQFVELVEKGLIGTVLLGRRDEVRLAAGVVDPAKVSLEIDGIRHGLGIPADRYRKRPDRVGVSDSHWRRQLGLTGRIAVCLTTTAPRFISRAGLSHEHNVCLEPARPGKVMSFPADGGRCCHGFPADGGRCCHD